jgi:DNA-binding response OmpR family regulator
MSSYHLLLIEDDPAVAQSLQDGLVRDGFSVTWKSNGADGVAHAQKHLPHLVLLDVRLPDGSGFDFCKQMRQKGLRMPVIMLTAQQDAIDKVLGLEIGADDYVTKPFNLRELLSRIRAQLRRAYGEFSNADANHIYLGDLLLDLSSGQVLRDEQPLNLTPTEFRLLTYLARHRGQVLSRGQIVEAVWGHSPDPDSEQTVNVHIRRLREKIEYDPSRPELILTVPGLGYRLATPATPSQPPPNPR